MTRGRNAPPKAPTMPPDDELRRAALLTLDIEAIRIWAATYLPDGYNTIALTSDADLLIDMHHARLRDETMPQEERYISALVLADRGDELAKQVLAEVVVQAAEGGKG